MRAAGLALTTLLAVHVAACGGTVVFEEDGGEGGNGNGNGSTATASNANANAGTAGPGGVGGADGGASPPSSAGVGGPGCVYHERSATYCYTHNPCDDDHVRETECELGPADVRQCWCFQDGTFVAQCEVTSSYCVSALAECCEPLWP